MKKSTLRRRTLATRATAVLAAGGLVLGVAACSDNNDDAAENTTAASTTAAETAEATDSADDVTSVDDLPEDMKKILEQQGGEAGVLGAFKSFERDGDNALATFEHGYIAQSAEFGAQPIKGMIAQTWAEDGALKNPIGLPTAPEKGEEVKGWDQSFENGVLGWHPDETGKFSATKTLNDETAKDKAESAIDGAVDDAKDAADDAKDRAGSAIDDLKGDK